MKKTTLIIMVLCLFVVSVACANVKGDVTTETSTTVPATGYPSGTVQMPMMYLNGKLYVFDYYCHSSNMDAEEYIKEHGFVQIGETKSERNEEPPTEEYSAARLPVGTKIYSDKGGKIYVLEGKRVLALKLKET